MTDDCRTIFDIKAAERDEAREALMEACWLLRLIARPNVSAATWDHWAAFLDKYDKGMALEDRHRA